MWAVTFSGSQVRQDISQDMDAAKACTGEARSNLNQHFPNQDNRTPCSETRRRWVVAGLEDKGVFVSYSLSLS
jgi:hypothetical protein